MGSHGLNLMAIIYSFFRETGKDGSKDSRAPA